MSGFENAKDEMLLTIAVMASLPKINIFGPTKMNA